MNNYKNVLKNLNKETKVELETQKVELAIGDELRSLASKTDTAFKKVDKELDEAFEPIRRIEKISESIVNKIDGFKDFKNTLMDMEAQYQKDVQKIKSAEQVLKAADEVVYARIKTHTQESVAMVVYGRKE